jgi:16S rRNA G966 N2-methylase RsmD
MTSTEQAHQATGKTTQARLIHEPTTAAEDRDAARAVYVERLAGYLNDPEFRSRPGFPQGTDESILAMSDPPAYTACPNPYIADWIAEHGRPYDPNESYHREPFAVDVSEGKTDPLYRAHGYHTKVPHLAIVPSILHYTKPGDVVLDGFCGSGMTGVAAQWCGIAPDAIRRGIEATWRAEDRPAPQWGARHAVLNDLSPAATFIAANYTLPFAVDAFADAARGLLDEVDNEIDWMYETRHSDGRTGRIEYTVWSQVFACPECGADINFTAEALDEETKRVADEFPCPYCKARLSKKTLDKVFETQPDPASGRPWQHVRFVPVSICYTVGRTRYEKVPDSDDLAVLERIRRLPLPPEVPTNRFPVEEMYHGSRIAPKGFTHVHHFFLPRAAQVLGLLWRKATAHPDPRLRHMLVFTVEQAIWGMSVLNRYSPSHFSQVNRSQTGVYYVPSQMSEVSPRYILDGKVARLEKAFRSLAQPRGECLVTTDTCADLGLPPSSVDYIFTDPPFGENIYYADLNFLVESWHGVMTDAGEEAIVDRAKKKGLPEYQDLMRDCFREYHRVLKPGRWMTVVFHNSRNSVWNAIQEAMLSAGFVVADVRTMDKRQGSYRQVTSTAVKQDLVISAYKPAEAFERRFALEQGSEDGAWDFVRQHLERVPGVVVKDGVVEVIAQRQADLLFDRMVAFHVQRGLAVPLSNAEFRAGLQRKFVERDGMYFLPDQVAAYDTARIEADQLGQLPLLVNDERSTIQWLRQQLDPALGGKPQTYQEIQPQFLRQLNQARHEQLPELMEILQQNFLEDDDGRWRPPDPGSARDLERLRQNALLREFAQYLDGRGQLRMFRTEAVRAGFADAYRRTGYAEIVKIAERLPETVLQEDPDLLMYYDNALLRVE